MARLPKRHPNHDFFVLNLSDVAFKDDKASMEHPIFSLSTRPDHRHLVYKNGDDTLEVIPSGKGLPTVFDKDILLFCISQLVAKKNRGEEVGKNVKFTAHQLLIATNKPTNNLAYDRLEEALVRLRGTTFKTNIRSGDTSKTRVFGFIDQGGFVEHLKKKNGEMVKRRSNIEITLSDFTMEAIQNMEVLTISNEYFELSRPLQRRIYEIARKHCGMKKSFKIGLSNLHRKVGTKANLRKFRFNLREIIKEGDTPDYTIHLDDKDMVTFRSTKRMQHLVKPDLFIPEWAEEKCRKIAREKRRDFHGDMRDFQDFAKAQTKPADNIGAACVGFFKQKPNLA